MPASASSTKQNSPLHRTVLPFAAPPTSTSNPGRQPRRSSVSSVTSIDEPVVAAAFSSSSGHRSRPSTSALLPSDGDTSVTDDFEDQRSARDRQRRLRSYEDDDDVGGIGGVRQKVMRLSRRVQRAYKANEGLFLIALSQVFFASMNTAVKLLQVEAQMPVWQLIFIRMLATFVGCYGWLRCTGDPHPFLGPPGVRLLLCVRGVVGFFGLAPGYWALQYLSLSDATTISFLSPVLVGLLAFVILREPYSRLEALVGFTSLLGTVFIAKPAVLFPAAATPIDLPGDGVTPEERIKAVGIALFGVLGASGAYLTIRAIGKRASPMHSISYFSFYSVIVSLLYPLVFHSPPVFHLEKRFFLLITPIGVFGFFAQALLTMGLQREKAGRGTLAVYSNLIFAMILERLVFGVLPDAWSILGAFIIVGGALRVALEKQKPASSTSSTSGAGGGTSRSASVATVVDPIEAEEEGRKVKGERERGGNGEERPLTLGDDEDGLSGGEEEATGNSAVAAARGLGAER